MYIIVEIQTNADGTVGTLVDATPDFNVASQIYHNKLSYAAVSQVACHSVAMLEEDGGCLKHEAFWHQAESSESEE